jgi:hypothetical protein
VPLRQTVQPGTLPSPLISQSFLQIILNSPLPSADYSSTQQFRCPHKPHYEHHLLQLLPYRVRSKGSLRYVSLWRSHSDSKRMVPCMASQLNPHHQPHTNPTKNDSSNPYNLSKRLFFPSRSHSASEHSENKPSLFHGMARSRRCHDPNRRTLQCGTLLSLVSPSPLNPKKPQKPHTMENLIAITVRYIGPTNNRGSRIKMDLPRFGATRVISYNYEKRDAEEGAVAWLAENGIVPVARACGKDMSAILLISFQDMKTLEVQFSF